MLSTGASNLDRLLGGGLRPPLLLELSGPPASGKTQLCHQLAVMVQLPREKGGLSGKALYIDTEGTFRPERVLSMARFRGLDPELALENVLVVEAPSQVELAEAVMAVEKLGVQLVLVDSIAFPFASPRSVGEARRAWGRMAAVLKRLALWGGLAVVVNAERGGRVVGDPYASMWVDKRVKLEPLGGGLVEAHLALPWSPGKCKLKIAEEGILPAD
jgi:DNA repair protein RadA